MQQFRNWCLAGLVVAAVSAAAPAAAKDDAAPATPEVCKADDGGLTVSRFVEIDTSSGPLFGDITKQVKEESFLKPKEVVLTFDDGPMPWITNSILDTLDRFCTKATFFAVGKMAVAYPTVLRKIAARGHTVGGHTWSHPLNLKRLKLEQATVEIEKGMAAISLATGGQAAPFFRFPGLSDNAPMLDALQKRGIASFTVDVVSDDSYINNPAKLIATTLARVEARKGGILLFHDIKSATAKALPSILTELQRRGYKVVHMQAKAPIQPLPEMVAEVQPILVKKDPPQGQAAAKAAMIPFFGTVGPQKREDLPDADEPSQTADAAVEKLAPTPRDRNSAEPAASSREVSKANSDNNTSGSKRRATKANARATGKHATSEDVRPSANASERAQNPSSGDRWTARIRQDRLSRTLYD